MKIAVGGYSCVANSYAKNLGGLPELELVGAYDRNEGNLESFSRRRSGLDAPSHRRLIEVSVARVATRMDRKVDKKRKRL
jgi:hypothetical protein